MTRHFASPAILHTGMVCFAGMRGSDPFYCRSGLGGDA